jgi:hypothetical protein
MMRSPARKASSSIAKGKRSKDAEEDIDIDTDRWAQLFSEGAEKKVGPISHREAI